MKRIRKFILGKIVLMCIGLWVWWSKKVIAKEKRCLKKVSIYLFNVDKETNILRSRVEERLKGAQSVSKWLQEVFSWFTEAYALKWTKDPWYVLWDAIQYPNMMLFRKKGDCEDFANLMNYIIPSEFKLPDDAEDDERCWTHRGMTVLIRWEGFLPKAHVVNIWENAYRFFVTSNLDFFETRVKDFNEIFEAFGVKNENILGYVCLSKGLMVKDMFIK